MIKVLAIIKSMNAKSSFIRIVQILKLLDTSRFDVTFVQQKRINLLLVFSCDVLVVQRAEDHSVVSCILLAKLLGKKIVYEIDDNLLDIPAASKLSRRADRIRRNVRNYLDMADLVNCSTNRLKESLCRVVPNKKIVITENSIDASVVQPLREMPRGKVRKIVISNTDYFKLLNSDEFISDLRLLVSEYGENLRIYTIGIDIEELHDCPNVIHIHSMNYTDYIRFLIDMRFDLALVPLEESDFHACKSVIKYLDFSVARTPVVCSDVFPYKDVIVSNENGLLVRNGISRSWYSAVNQLLGDDVLRSSIAEKALQDVVRNYSLEKSLKHWEELLIELVGNGKSSEIDASDPASELAQVNGLVVSVAVCTYNGARHIEAQLQSIIDQTRPPDEIIVRDDGSSDGTLDLVYEISRQSRIPVKVFRNDKNLGVTRNFQAAILDCTGDVVFLADQDDQWFQNKIEKMLRPFQEDSTVGMVYSDALVSDALLASKGFTLFDSGGRSQTWKGSRRDPRDILKRPNIKGCTMALNRKLAVSLLPIPERDGKPVWTHDYWIAFGMHCAAKVVVQDEPLMLYRIHDANVSGLVAPGRAGEQKRNRIYSSRFSTSRTKSRAALYECLFEFAETARDQGLVRHSKSSAALLQALQEDAEILNSRIRIVDTSSSIKRTALAFVFLCKGWYSRFKGGSFQFFRDLLGRPL